MRPLSPCLAGLLALAASGGIAAAADPTRTPIDPPGAWKYCDPMTARIIAGVAQSPVSSVTDGQFWATGGDEGPALGAKIGNCSGIAAGPDGSIYFCATASHAVRRITPDGIVHRVAGVYDQKVDYVSVASIGDGGPARAAHLDHPFALAVDASGSLYILDYARLRKVTPDGIIRTVAGSTFQPAWTLTALDLQAATADFRFTGPAIQARLWTAWEDNADLQRHGDLAVAHDGSIYLQTDLGVRRIDPAGRIAPLIEGGYWPMYPSAKIGSYSLIDIALDSHDALFATGGPVTLSSANAAPDIYAISPSGSVSRLLGSDDNKGFFNDPDGWNVGPVSAGKSFAIQGLHVDGGGRMWFQSAMDGAHFCHLDGDGVVRWSGAFETHSASSSNVDGGPAPLNFGQNGPIGRTSAPLPDGRWAMAQFDRSASASSYPVIRVLDRSRPSRSPALTLSANSASVAMARDATVETPIHLRVTNSGTNFGELGFTSDQPWLRVSQPADTQPDASGHLAFAVGAQHDLSSYGGSTMVAVRPLPNMAPGDYTGHFWIHLLGTTIAPSEVTVALHVTAGAGGNLAPRITSRQQYFRVGEDGVLTIPLSAVDDGLPNQPHALSWSVTRSPAHGAVSVSAAGVVTYVPPRNFNTMAAADASRADEQFDVQVSDGSSTDGINLIVHVDSINDPPVADAGPDQTAGDGGTASLHGTASDVDVIGDATGKLQPQPLQISWSEVSGLGTVSFSDPGRLTPTATFSLPGTYLLRLTVSDGVATSADTVLVSVPSTISQTSAAVAESAGSGPQGGKGCGMGSGIALLGLAGLVGLGTRRSRRV